VRSKTFALAAVALMMVSAFGVVLLTCTDGAEAAPAPDPPYAFSQTLTVDIRSSLPKYTTYYMVAGDTFNVHRGAWDVWYGGWFNTKYEKYVDITSVKWEQLGYNVGVTWDAGGISGLAPYGHDVDRLRVDWVLRYSDHGSGYHTVEDSGYFYIKVQGPVGVRLDCGDGVYKELLGRNSVVLPHEPKDGMTHVGWRQGTKIYQPGETYTTRMTLPILYDLTAVYTIDYYTITFDSAGGSAVSPRQVAVGDAYGELPTPVKEGYTFLGWYDGTTRVTESTVPTKDVTLRAEWSPNIIQYTAPAGNLAAGTYWSHQLSTTPGVSITVSGAGTSWIQVNGGMLSGVPPSAGVYEVSVTLTAPNYLSQSQSFTLNVVPKLEVTNNPAAGAIAYVVL